MRDVDHCIHHVTLFFNFMAKISILWSIFALRIIIKPTTNRLLATTLASRKKMYRNQVIRYAFCSVKYLIDD